MNLSRWRKGIAMDSYGASRNKQKDLLAPSCFNGRSRGLQRDIHAKKKGQQPQGVASVPDNCSCSSNSVLRRKARKPKAMIYT
ncbi:hypothetical protein Tco_1085950 [Tanacetum coccineum]